MKKLFIVLATLLSGCGTFVTGEGIFSGRLVDVEYTGIFFKSCEAQFQIGEQSSTIAKGSTKDKIFCDELSKKVGTVVTVRYKSWANPCCATMDAPNELVGFGDEK